MHVRVRRTLQAVTAVVTLLLACRPVLAQVTTGNIVGTVTDPQGGTVPGAVILATHTPTGTVYQATSDVDGRFQLLELRVGGPYDVKVTMSGFAAVERTDVMIDLGADRTLDFKMALAGRSETVDVVAAAPQIDFTQAGSTGNISSEQKDAMPTIARSIFDIVQANPYFSNYVTTGNGQSSISVAGRNNRYNNIQIDGAVNNDIFGLSNTGTPEGQSGSQPISLDAIQELQLLVSPYDVRQGGFSGGGVNIVTKSGANMFSGDGFLYGQNQDMFGKYFNANAIDRTTLQVGQQSAAEAKFSNKQGGGSIGGPIMKNKAFFFFSTDSQREQTPSGVGADTFNNGASQAAIDTVISTLENQYHYNPVGSSAINPDAQFDRLTNNDKTFVRADVNLSPNEHLTVRNNFVNSLADSGTPTNTLFLLPDNYVRFRIKTDSTVGQLNSTIGGSSVNEFRIAATEVRNNRGGEPFEQQPFPQTTVNVAPGVTVVAGRDRSSTANQLYQDDIEVNDDFTSVHGGHTLSFGTHDEFFHFQNLFIQNTFGTYTFTNAAGSGIANLQTGLAQAYSFNFSNTSNPLQQADFRVAQYGFYVGDQWHASKTLTVTGGVRADMPRFNHSPNPNPLSVTDFSLRTDVVPSPAQWSPRIGFGWDPTGTGKQQFRGGVGIFSGRTPYVWISNQYSNNGLDFSAISISTNNANQIPYVTDATAQPTNPTGGTNGVSVTKQVINLIDPNFKFPSQVRANFAYDTALPWGLVGRGEFIYNKTLEDILYQNLNIQQTGTATLDGRPTFSVLFPTVGNTIYLTNTTQGHGWSMSYDVERQFRNTLGFEMGYFYGQQKTPEESESSVALTSWQDVYSPNPNSPPLTTADFDPGHRVTANVSYELPDVHGVAAILSMFYSGQSGHPYTLSYGAEANGDGSSFNDNLFVPTNSSPLTYTANGTASSFDVLQTQLLNQMGSCATSQEGTIFIRNSCRAPWVNTLNARLTLRLPFKRVKADLTLDVLNVLNLLNDNWGIVRYVNFNQISIINPITTSGQVTGMNLTTLQPTFTDPNTKTSVVVPAAFSPFSIDDLRSRAEMQVGARFSF